MIIAIIKRGKQKERLINWFSSVQWMRGFHAQRALISAHKVFSCRSDECAFKSCIHTFSKSCRMNQNELQCISGRFFKCGLEGIACMLQSEPSVLKQQFIYVFLPWLRSGCRTGRLAGAQSRAWFCRKDNGRDAGTEVLSSSARSRIELLFLHVSL